MTRRASAAGIRISLVAVVVLTQNCGSRGAAPTPPERPYFVGLQVFGNTRLTAIGETSQLSAVASFSDGTSTNVTNSVSWTVRPGSMVSISNGGLVQAHAFGITSVQTTYGVPARANVATVVSVTPPGTFAVAGQIRDPVAGGIAAVTVMEPASARSAVTDDDGRFMLAGLTGTELRLTRDGYEPVTTAVAPFDVRLDVLMQPALRLQAGASTTGTIGVEDLSYVVAPGKACGACRLIRLQSASMGAVTVRLSWFVGGARMFLWAGGQEFPSTGSLELIATFPVSAGETILYVGAASTLRDVDFQLTSTFAPTGLRAAGPEGPAIHP